MGFRLPLPASEEWSKYKTRTDKQVKSRPRERQNQKWFRKDSTERRNAVASAPPRDGSLPPCYRPAHLGTHQRVLAERGDPNPDGHGIQARSRNGPDNGMPLFLLACFPRQPQQGCLQASVGGGLGLVRAALMQT